MNRLFLWLCTLFIVLPLAGQPPARRLVMVSVDGLMPATVRNAEKLGIRIPNLREFRDKGAVSEGLTGVFPSMTFPSHTAIITGQRPARHGIITNTQFDPEGAIHDAWYWYAGMIKTPALWDAARQAGLTTAAVNWPVTVGADIDYNYPEFVKPRRVSDDHLYRALVTPGLLAEFEKANGPLRITGQNFDAEYYDDFIGRFASFLIESKKPHLLFVHLVDLDHDQHLNGPQSPQALRTLEHIDAVIGRLRKAVDAAGLGAETRWIVLSDHGFLPVEKRFNANAFLASLGFAADPGKPGTWRISAQAQGGSIAFIAKDPKDLDAQNQVTSALRILQDQGTFGIDRILTQAELSKLEAYPDAFAAVGMKSGWMAGPERSGPWVTPSGNTRGTHGFLPGPPDMEAAFMALGPGIPKRQLSRGELTDVAITAARLLGIAFPTAGGRDLLGN